MRINTTLKSLLLSSILSLLVGALKAQQKIGKLYDLYYVENGQIYPTGMGFRNDSIFLENAALANIVAIRRTDSTYSYILINFLRELPNVKKDTIKKVTLKKKTKV